MSFFKKVLSRSRSNSYVDDDYERDNETSGGAEPRNYDPNRPPSSWKKYDDAQQYQDQAGDSSPTSPYERQQRGTDGRQDSKMYSQDSQHQQQMPFRASARNSNTSGMMTGRSSRDGFVDVPSMSQTLPPSVSGTGHSKLINNTAAPDLLTQAFNAALQPFTEKIAGLEEQVADLQAFVDQLEKERLDVFAWIDKRGLRPDLPPSIAKAIDTTPGISNTSSADVLNGQLDRKITIVNFDLHRLQDDLNDSISSAHFASSMGKFLPDIQRLAALPGGPRYAYDLLIKLVGNLNSHGGVDRDNTGSATDAELEDDRRARADFGDRMDEELIDVVRRRNAEGEQWDVQKEVRRFERNAAYLKNIGFESYFPRTLEVLKREAGGGSMSSAGGQGGASGAGYGAGQSGQSGQYAGNGNSIGVGGMQGPGGAATPPRYNQK